MKWYFLSGMRKFLLICVPVMILSGCSLLFPQSAEETFFPTPVTLVPTGTQTVVPSVPASTATDEQPASETPPAATLEIPSTPTVTPTAVTSYSGPGDRVTLEMPAAGRYIVLGDSLSYGAQLIGQNTYEDLCNWRWPYTEKLTEETGVATTANLDFGWPMKTPFWTTTDRRGKITQYCVPRMNDPILSTSVPASNSQEWVEELIYYPLFQTYLDNPDNRVVLFLVGADIFAEKVQKPFISDEQYEQNVGQIIAQLAAKGKVVYLAKIPHVVVGISIFQFEVESLNERIDRLNQILQGIIEKNGFLDAGTGEWVDFGVQAIEQDGLTLFVKTVQAGPALDALSDGPLQDHYSKDGLHYHKEGYDLMGISWAEALRAPVAITGLETAK